MTRFTDFQAAIEEGEFLADQVRKEGQFRSVYLVQYGNVIRVHTRRPKHLPIAMVVRPKSALRLKA